MRNKSCSALLFISFLLISAGCSYQTKIIQNRHWQLNETIRQTQVEQLLLNIVRLRYYEMPYFLQVSSISTQFSAGGGLGVSGTIPEHGSKVLGLDGSVSYVESPVVTWAIVDSREYLGRLMAPIGADQLTVLAQAGWDPADTWPIHST
jgi:hypothetical protein